MVSSKPNPDIPLLNLSTSNIMDQLKLEYQLLGETPTREQTVKFIHRLVEKEGFYSFSLLKELLSVNETVVRHSADLLELLESLADGNWQAYKASGINSLSSSGETKLKELALMKMCVGKNELRLSEIQKQLDLRDEELAKFLITSVYHEIITGKINAEKKLLMIYEVQSGEVSNKELEMMDETLSRWIEKLDTMISGSGKNIAQAS